MHAKHTLHKRALARLPALARGGLVLASAATLTLAHAALTDIAQTPVLAAAGTPVKPNVLFILDDSGSMEGDYLPEAANFSVQTYGSHTSQCNGMAYNPNTTYAVPVDSTGAALTGGSISSAMQANVWLESINSVAGSNLAQISSGDITITANGTSGSYTVGSPVTLYDNGTKTRWMIGIVKAWNSSSRVVTITVSDSSGTATQADPYIGIGWPPFVYFTYSGSQAARGFTYQSSGATDTSATFYKECAAKIGASPGSGVFTKVVVRSDSTQAQNLANWRAYYYDRLRMMKTIVSQVFKSIDDRYRIGFATIHSKEAKETTSKDFLHVRDFDATQKAKFYDYLNATTASGSTPLRGALTLAGRYYAKKARNQGTYDPVQYSCQKNFAILSSDGMWNTGNEDSSAEFGPYKLTGTTTIGQQDRTVDKPYRDASQGNASGGSSDTLADIAMFYYATDLRTSALGNCTGAMGVDVCTNNVKNSTKDSADWQHLSTYTLSLGQNGFLKYDPAYEKQPSGDYLAIMQGTKQWANPVLGSDTDPGKVDDLWHAAVNGRGTFYNAADPTAVSQGLTTALATMDPVTGTGAAAATSSLTPVVGNNQVFVASYTTATWVGDLRAYRMNPRTGEVKMKDGQTDLADWSAAARLKLNASRNIYYAKGTVLRSFTYANLSADGFGAPFENACTGTKLSQCASLTPANKTLADNGTNLVNYLRGTENTALFRAREHALGDIVGSSPVFVGVAQLSSTDSAYASYLSTSKTRRGMVYAGANDGMLHAFDAATGDELWAFVPAGVRANMYKLADNNYSTNHQFFVDASPLVADVKIGSAWKTVLISGLGGGGKSYFALDITNPTSPVPLWEFTDTNLGFTFATPLIVQRPNGNWVAVFSSGYNNVGDGLGHLMMVDIANGSKIADVATSAGSAATPAGLGPISAWVRGSSNGSAQRYYAGDTLGNVWRFDPENLLGFTNKAVKLATLVRNNTPQPVTTAPILAELNYKGFVTPVVYVGTGRMLGLTDVQNTEIQSIYGIRDPLKATGWGDVRTSAAPNQMVQQVLSNRADGLSRTATRNPVDWSKDIGWYLDLLDAGERINVDMRLRYNTLVAASNVPKSVASCANADDGYAWLYYLDISFGSDTGSSVATKLTQSMVVGFGDYELDPSKSCDNCTDPPPPPGGCTGGALVTYSDGKTQQICTPKPQVNLPSAKKASWRELIDR